MSYTRTIKRPTRRKNKKKQTFLFLPDSVQAFIARRFVDICASIFVFSGLFLTLALLTYEHTDPSGNTARNLGSTQTIENWGGGAGAWIADIFAQTIGIGGFAIAAGIIIWGLRLFRRHKMPLFPLRIAALLLTSILFATACARIGSGSWLVHPYIGSSTGTLIFTSVARTLSVGPAFLINIISGVAAIGLFIFAAAVRKHEITAVSSAFWRTASTAAYFTYTAIQNFFQWIRHYNDDEYAPKSLIKRDPIEKRPAAKTAPALAEIREEEQGSDQPVKPVAKNPNIPVVTAQAGKNEIQTQKKFQYEGVWQLPDPEILEAAPAEDQEGQLNEAALRRNAELLQNVLADFKIDGEIVSIHPGPVVTLYELEPAAGVKSSRVIGLADDIARSMSAISVRCAVVPGRNVIGIELPNKTRCVVYMQTMLMSRVFEKTRAHLPLILGKDIGGKPIIADLAKMPHLLVAGTTGSGKSVAVNSMILSLLYRLPPEKCRFIMIDPKMLELSVYDGIPHLLSPVVTEPGKAVVALKWTVQEMENRYRAMSKLGVRNIEGYNERLREAVKKGEEIMTRVQTGFDIETGKPTYEEQPMDMTELPYIVVIVDEFADLMLVAGKDVEAAIQRLAQMARAAGIHLIMATQRPSVDVITGVVKANFPTRISFSVTSKIDSRTILGESGAEQLLGMGDMLYMAPGGRITRVHGPFVSDDDVEKVVNFLKTQGEPAYISGLTDDESLDPSEVMDAIFDSRGGGGEKVDELYDEAVALVAREGKASTSFVQRYLQIGYNRAARIIEEMERQGVISKATKTGKREVLVGDYSDM